MRSRPVAFMQASRTCLPVCAASHHLTRPPDALDHHGPGGIGRLVEGVDEPAQVVLGVGQKARLFERRISATLTAVPPSSTKPLLGGSTRRRGPRARLTSSTIVAARGDWIDPLKEERRRALP